MRHVRLGSGVCLIALLLPAKTRELLVADFAVNTTPCITKDVIRIPSSINSDADCSVNFRDSRLDCVLQFLRSFHKIPQFSVHAVCARRFGYNCMIVFAHHDPLIQSLEVWFSKWRDKVPRAVWPSRKLALALLSSSHCYSTRSSRILLISGIRHDYGFYNVRADYVDW